MRPLLLQYHTRPVVFVKYNRDGDLFLSCGLDGVCNLMRSTTGDRLGTYTGHGKAAVRSCDITSDSEMVVTGGADSRVCFYEAKTGEVIYELDHGGILKCVEFNTHPSVQDRLLTCSDKFKDDPNSVTIWRFDFSDRLQPRCYAELQIDKNLPMKANQVRWGPLDQTLISIHDEGTFCVWDATDGSQIKLLDAHVGPIRSLQFNEDRTLMITASRDKSVRVWDTKDYKMIKILQSETSFNDAAISPLYEDEKNPKYHIIAGGGVEAREVTQTTESGFESVLFNFVLEEEIGKMKGHFGPMNTVAIHPHGTCYVTGGEEGLIRLTYFDPDYFTKKD